MTKPKKPRKLLSAKDFCGDGEPYTEIIVTISIRLLGAGITRSRLAVNTYPDPALRRMAVESLKKMRVQGYGLNEDGVFGACLSENFNGWEDMNKDYPKIDENLPDEFKKDDAKAMNAYIAKSVDWVKELHKKAMAEALLNDGVFGAPDRIH
jgi:Ran GTPase-activating protein (RanGAP) involved in mRNA processing and transport